MPRLFKMHEASDFWVRAAAVISFLRMIHQCYDIPYDETKTYRQCGNQDNKRDTSNEFVYHILSLPQIS